MASTLPNGVARESHPLPSKSTNNKAGLDDTLKRLSLNTAASIASPTFPRIASPSRPVNPRTLSSPSNGSTRGPSRSLLLYSPSSMSTDNRSSTPPVHHQASMNSLHGIGGMAPNRSTPTRRASAQHLDGNMAGNQTKEEDVAESKPRHTPASIARAYFQSELRLHDQDDTARAVDTVAILHDSCYGHRYSRPRTSKASLSTIVERPERIQASVLGLSVAYIRLGGRHAEGLFPLHPTTDTSSIPTIPFRIRKTSRKIPLTSQAVTNVHGLRWMEELKIMCDSAEARLAMNGKELTRPEMHRADPASLAKLHEGDLYLCAESLDAMEGALGAVCEGVDSVFQGSLSGMGPCRAFVTIRPPGHHCSASYPSGFCWVNNVHVGISHAALTHGLTHAAIIDFDLHHGDGSQAVAWEHNSRAITSPKNALPWKKTSIGYFSLHDINSYPCEMGDEEKVKNASLCIESAHGQNIWNVHLHAWKSEREFWELYENKYSILLEKTRNYLRTQTARFRDSPTLPAPRAAIFLSAGFDASEWESSGMQRHKVNVPTEFYARLTRDVVALAAEEGTAVNGRVISVLEGGYSDRALCSGVLSHLSGLAGGKTMGVNAEPEHAGLGYEMGQKIGALADSKSNTVQAFSAGIQSYDPLWWCLPNLEQLEAVVNPVPVVEPKKPRDVTPTYSSPTTSFMAKVQSPRVQRSASNMSSGSPRDTSRAPSPPPPEVRWTVAAHELSKLLIPSERQTLSCKPEDLSAEATRVRRGRQSEIAPLSTGTRSESTESSSRMALRVRKSTKPTIDTVAEDETKKPIARGDRRKTVAGAAMLATAPPNVPYRITTPMLVSSHTQSAKQSTRKVSPALSSDSVISNASSSHPIQPRIGSNGNAIMPVRSGSALDIRPDSSIGFQATSVPPVGLIKTRAPAAPRAEVRNSRFRPKPSHNDTDVRGPSSANASGSGVPATDRSSSGGILPTKMRKSSKGKQAIQAPATRETSPNVDALSWSMNKIQISLTTKAQREAREQVSKQALPITTTSITTDSAAAPDKAHPAAKESKNSTLTRVVSEAGIMMQDGSISMPEPIPVPESLGPLPASLDAPHAPIQPSTPPIQHLSSSNQGQEPKKDALSPNFPAFPIQSQPPPTAQHPNPNRFVSFQPPNPPATIHYPPPPTDLRWLPPNVTETPAAMRDGISQALPVWSSTGAIPFAGLKKKEDTEDNESNKSIWDVPVTPKGAV